MFVEVLHKQQTDHCNIYEILCFRKLRTNFVFENIPDLVPFNNYHHTLMFHHSIETNQKNYTICMTFKKLVLSIIYRI